MTRRRMRGGTRNAPGSAAFNARSSPAMRIAGPPPSAMSPRPCDPTSHALRCMQPSVPIGREQPGIGPDLLETIPRPRLKEQGFDSGLVRLNVASGPDSGPPAVLLHGVARRWQDFLPILPALTLRWHVHAIDFRGHGRSGRAAGAY